MTIINQSSQPIKKILILSANPEKKAELSLDKEVRDIQEGIDRGSHRDLFQIISMWAVRFRDIRQALLKHEPDIVHFSGHGDKEGIIIDSKIGLNEHISTGVLSNLFKLCAHHVQCVILNACYSAPQAEAINKHIHYVIGMKEKIKDRAAIEFSAGFYDALAAGKSVEVAFDYGCIGIQQECPGLSEHLIPVLKIKKEKPANLFLHIETTHTIHPFQADLGENTTIVKNRLINQLKLAKTFENGQPIIFYLQNKTRDRLLDDNKTLRDNGVQKKDTLVFLFQVDTE